MSHFQCFNISQQPKFALKHKLFFKLSNNYRIDIFSFFPIFNQIEFKYWLSIAMTLKHIEQTLFKKQYQLLISMTMPSPKNTIEELIIATIEQRGNIYQTFANKQQDWQGNVYREKKRYTEMLQKYKTVDTVIRYLMEVAMEFFVFQIVNSTEVAIEQERKLLKLLDKLPTGIQLMKKPDIWAIIKQSIVLSTSLLQLQLKKLLTAKKLANLQQLTEFEKRLRQISQIHPITRTYCKKLFTILVHIKIYNLNITAKQAERLVQISNIVIHDNSEGRVKLLSLDTKIITLYNCLKTLLGSKQSAKGYQQILNQLYGSLNVRLVYKYEEHLLHLFFIIKGQIFKKAKAMEGGASDQHQQGKSNQYNEQQKQEEEQEQEQNQLMTEKFSTWSSVNLDETMLGLDEVARNVIRHRVASLSTVIGMKLNLSRFCLNFLQLMYDGPFNNDAQTIKLCFQLFQARQFSKLHNSLQVVLSAASCKYLKQREVLLSLCCIFTGLYLQNRQQALLYAKLNHEQNKCNILREQTLLQQVGFAYYNLAIHQNYLCNRSAFLAQASSNLLNSTKINPNNYLVQYCLAKIFLRNYQYDLAYKHIMQCCKSGRGEWVPFSLLACIYFCQRRVSKATLIIEQLLKKYPNTKLLHYFKAYLQVNKLLLQVEYDEQVEAARQLGDDIYQLCKDRIVKAKIPTNLLKSCQEYHQLSLGLVVSEYDQNYFAQPQLLNPDVNLQTMREGAGYQEGEGEQVLLQIIPLLLQVGQIGLSEGLIKSLPDSPQKTYCKALLHECKKEKTQAIIEYKSVLMQQPYHTLTLINLAIIDEDICDSMHYLDIAQKFTSDNRLWLAKGLLLSRIGRISEANQAFLKQNQQGWVELQPDLILY